MIILVEAPAAKFPAAAKSRVQGASGWFGAVKGFFRNIGLGGLVGDGPGGNVDPDGGDIGFFTGAGKQGRTGTLLRGQRGEVAPQTLDLGGGGGGGGSASLPSSTGATLQAIEDIDRKLLADIEQPPLWRMRAQICRDRRLESSAQVSDMTADLLLQDEALFLHHIREFSAQQPDLGVFASGQADARAKGELLARIRRPTLDAEFHFALNLLYSFQFSDQDIFQEAVTSMRSGYLGEQRPFFVFGETRMAGSGSSSGPPAVSLLNPGDKPRIQSNVNNFLLRLGCFDLGLIALVRFQFTILLGHHLNPALAEELVSDFPFPEHLPKTLTRKRKDLREWPHLPQMTRRLESTQRWFEMLTMDRLKQLSLHDMFVGNLYREAISFPRRSGDRNDLVEQVDWMRELSAEVIPPGNDGKPLARAIFQRFSAGYPDWSAYFQVAKRSVGIQNKARGQRVLLLMVTEFGPMPEFESYIHPLVLELSQGETWDIYGLTLYCDIFRLSLVYKRQINEQLLFNAILNRLPRPPHGWEDFRSAAEHLILCLFLNGSKTRRFQLDNMLERTMHWFRHASRMDDEKTVDEILTIISFLEVGVLADLVPESLEKHQFHERRRALWLEYARELSGRDGWKLWQSRISRSANFSLLHTKGSPS